MFDDFKRSISNVLNDRIKSPLYGTFVFSWCIWNWKAIYLTVFINDDKILGNKLDYIVDNHSSIWTLLVFPLVASVVLILAVPYLDVLAYKISLFYSNLRRAAKNKSDSARLLTAGESREIFDLLQKQEEITQQKDKRIAELGNQVENYKKQLEELKSTNDSVDNSNVYTSVKGNRFKNYLGVTPEEKKLYKKLDELDGFREDAESRNLLFDVLKKVYNGTYKIPELGADENFIEYMVINGLLNYEMSNGKRLGVNLTGIGQDIYRLFVNAKFGKVKKDEGVIVEVTEKT